MVKAGGACWGKLPREVIRISALSCAEAQR
jgi:hypothetical protein